MYLSDYDVLMNSGIIYHAVNNSLVALRYYTASIYISPTYPKPYYNKGNLYLDGHAYQKPLRCFTKAISLKHDYNDAYFNRGTGKSVTIQVLTRSISFLGRKPRGNC